MGFTGEDDGQEGPGLTLDVDQARQSGAMSLASGFDAEMERLDSDDGIIRQLAMQNLVAIAKHGGSTERIVSMMISRLQDPDKLFRALAVQGLSRGASEVRDSLVEAFAKTLQDSDSKVRLQGIRALKRASTEAHPAALAACSEALNDDSPFVRDAAEENLMASLNLAQQDQREKLSTSPNPQVRVAAIKSLASQVATGHAKSLEIVVGCLHDHDFQARIGAVNILGGALHARTPPEEALLGVAAALRDPHSDVVQNAVTRLAAKPELARGIPLVFEAALPLIGHKDPGLRSTAIAFVTALVNDDIIVSGSTDSWKKLLRVLELGTVIVEGEKIRKDPKQTVRLRPHLWGGLGAREQLGAAEAVGAIVGQGNKFLREVQPLLRAELALTKVAVIRSLHVAASNSILQVLASRGTEPSVTQALADPDARVRLAAVSCLACCPEGCLEASLPLISILSDDKRELRNAAADALSKLLGRTDREPKMRIVGLMFDNNGPQEAVGRGCVVGARYKSLEVGYIGHTSCMKEQVSSAAQRALVKMGVPVRIVRRGRLAVETAIDKFCLGHPGYELPANFDEIEARRAEVRAEAERLATRQSARQLLPEVSAGVDLATPDSPPDSP